MKYNFDVLAKRKNTNSVKYDEFHTSLPMWVADMDFLLAPKIKEAISKDLEVGAIGYTLIPDDFFYAFTDFYKRRYKVNIDKDELVYVSGVVTSIDAIFRTLTKPNDKVIMLSPIYHTFHNCLKNYNLEASLSELKYINGNYEIDFADLENRLKDEKSKIFLLCNPHNPVGKIFTEEELTKIDELANKYGVLVISDEIHGWITNPRVSYIPYHKIASGDNYICCFATSKAFNLAGLQSAVCLIKNKELRDKLQTVFYKDDIGEPNYFAVNANIAALRDSEDWLDAVNEYIYKNKVHFSSFIKNNIPELSCPINGATYMVWVDISKISSDSRDFAKRLNEETGLLVSPGAQFGLGGEGHLRINLATSLENVISAEERLLKFVRK